MAQQVGNLSQMYADLNRFGQNQDYERALRLSNKILAENKEESAAYNCKIVCMIQLARFNDALTAIHKEKKLSKDLVFEKAYCEYRLNRTQEALNTLRSAGDLDYRCKELLSQVLYRLEDYSQCYDLYTDLLKNSNDDFDEERETNLAAVLGSLCLWDEEEMDDPGLKESTYELCYNKACYLLGMGQIKEAEEKLRKAEVLCRKSLQDDPDTTEEEIDEEIAIIRIQLAYVLQLQKKNDEAAQLYNQVLKKKPSDSGIVAVISNNIVTINKDQNVFDSKKKMKAASADNLKQKLSSIQRKHIKTNQCLLHMHTNQGDNCRHLAKELKSVFPESEDPVLIEAAQFCKDKDVNQAVAVLEEYVKLYPDKAVSIQLVITQLYLQQGSLSKACDILKSLGDLSYRPGVVSSLVTLYLNQCDTESASEVLQKSVEWYQRNEPKSPDLTLLVKANANFQLKNGNPEVGAQMLEQMRKSNPKDPKILAQLISAYSKFNPKKAQDISKDLPSVDEIASSVDVESLESSFNTMGPKYLKKSQKTEPSPGAQGDVLIQKKKKKKKKKTKLPKNYNPDVIPDTERWIPRRERSYYKGKRKDKRKEIGKGPQGAVSPSADLDASKPSSNPGSTVSSPKPGAVSPSPQTSAPEPAQGPRQQRPVQANKKKKKGKGGKW